MSKKEEFIRRALAKNETFSHLCREFNISRKTGYALVNRYLQEGPSGLIPRSTKPRNHPNKTHAKTEEAIINLRLREPTWGARKLIKYLSNKGMLDLPAASTVTEILKRNNLISIEESLKRKKLIRFERDNPNDLWQMDFKGRFKLLSRQSCYPLTVIDDYSRFSLGVRACKNEQGLTVKNRLISIFEKYGLPSQINVDNGNPWGNATLHSHTTFTVWLMRLGIKVTHSRPRHPQTNGKCERFHRTLKNDLINRIPMRNFVHAQKLFDDWRYRYNYERPHEAIEMEVPASRFNVSKNKMPKQLPRIEYDEGLTLRKVHRDGYIHYNNNRYYIGEAFKDNHVMIKLDEIKPSINVFFGSFKIHSYDV